MESNYPINNVPMTSNDEDTNQLYNNNNNNNINQLNHSFGHGSTQIINNFHNQQRGSFSSSPSNFASYSPGANPPSFHSRNSLSDIRHPDINNSNFNESLNIHRDSFSNANNGVRTSLLTQNLQLQQLQQQQQQQQQNSPFNSNRFKDINPSPQYSQGNGQIMMNNDNDNNNDNGNNNNNNNNNAFTNSFNNNNISNSLSAFQIPITSSQFQRNKTGNNSYTPFHNTPSVVSNSYSSSMVQQQGNGFINMSKQSSLSENYPFQMQQPPHPLPPITTTDVSTDTAFASSSSSSLPGEVKQRYEDDQLQQLQLQQQGEFPPESFGQQRQQHMTQGLSKLSLSSRGGIFGSRASLLSSSILSQEEHLNIAEHPTNDLLLMLSALLQKIIELNDLLHPEHYSQQQNEQHDSNKYVANVLLFHGRNVPLISLHAYLTRILKYCPVTNDVFLSLLVYFDRIAKRANAGEFADKSQHLFVMDSYNIHRLIISGITVLSKFFSDVFYKNSRYAKVGGLPLDELNHLELQFLLLLDFELVIHLEEMIKYGDLLVKFWKREQLKLQALLIQQQQQLQQQQYDSFN